MFGRDARVSVCCRAGGVPDHAAEPGGVDGGAQDLVPGRAAGRNAQVRRAQVHGR